MVCLESANAEFVTNPENIDRVRHLFLLVK